MGSDQLPMGGQFVDTTYTKVFVGGLAWETQRDTMKKYFEQFGQILEAVVITDKNTGRSKGYGFVTFQEAESAMKACVDPAPVIDGRRANCNLASLGVQRSRPTSPQYGGSNRNFRAVKAFHGGGAAGFQGGIGFGGAAFASPVAATFPHFAVQQQAFPYNFYGYNPYSPDTYATSYYNMYGGAVAQFPVFGGNTAYYPYSFQFAQGRVAAPYNTYGQSYGAQYPAIYQYSLSSTAGVTEYTAQHYGGPVSLATPIAGMTMALPSPTFPNPSTSHHYRPIPTHFMGATVPTHELPLA